MALFALGKWSRELTPPRWRLEFRLPAGIAQLVEHDLAKVGVASSSLVSRSRFMQPRQRPGFCVFGYRPGGRVVMQRPAKPRTPVQFRPWPPDTDPGAMPGFLFLMHHWRACPGGGIGRRRGLKIR